MSIINDQTLILYNSLSKELEEFIPLNINSVGMYWCGPTVYDRAHIGNLRSSVVADLFYRILKSKFLNVNYVRNYTDIDDKIIQKSITNFTPINVIVSRATAQYIEDMGWVGNINPTHTPNATDHIPDMIEMIKKLVSYNYAYESNGHVFFEVSLFQSSGKLSNRPSKDSNTESRISENNYKKNSEDFVLWKPSNGDEPGWPSPWGFGRPGWHIECSAMSRKYLGEIFDLHGGGSDLLFPHHDNEIAQSCAAHSTDIMAKYWVHSGMLIFNNDKMSKSLGNIITSEILRMRNISGDALRFLFLSTHYRSILNFSEEALTQSRSILTKWYEKTKNVTIVSGFNELDQIIKDHLYLDLNTPAAITRMHELFNEGKYSDLLLALRFLGFKMQPIEYNEKNILEIAEKRAYAKLNKDYELADQLRKQINDMGFDLMDNSKGITDIKQKYLF